MAGRPLEMKEAFEEEIQTRITTKLEERYIEIMEAKAKNEDDDEDEVEDDEDEVEDEDEDEDEDDDEDEKKNESVEENFSNALRKAAVAQAKATNAQQPPKKKTVGDKIKGFFKKNEDYSGADEQIGAAMKSLHPKTSKADMFKKINDEYGCGKAKFEGLYASYCSK
jgi:ABC-type Zn2+ transport system substrate-binding protein/surface adhesin